MQVRSYAGRLDGCLDFGFTRIVRQICAGSQPTIPFSRFVAYLERTQRFFPADFTRPAFLDNHDMNRFLWVAQNDVERLRLALGVLFALGGPPVLYYGTEVGLSQPRPKRSHREEARHPMIWKDHQDNALFRYTQQLIALRKSHPALRQGSLRTHLLDEEQNLWLAERRHGPDRVWLALNLSMRQHPIDLPGERHSDLVTGETLQANVLLTPRSLRLLHPQATV